MKNALFTMGIFLCLCFVCLGLFLFDPTPVARWLGAIRPLPPSAEIPTFQQRAAAPISEQPDAQALRLLSAITLTRCTERQRELAQTQRYAFDVAAVRAHCTRAGQMMAEGRDLDARAMSERPYHLGEVQGGQRF